MSEAQTTAERNEALDITKGILVLLMVVYHWGNYFLGPVAHLYNYLRFLTPSFIFVSGVVIATVYTEKYKTNDARGYKRLASRGLRLLLLFTVLNLLMHFLAIGVRASGGLGIEGFVREWLEVYATGNSSAAAFKVLVPISYLLVLSAVFLPLSKLGKGYLVALALVGCVLVQIGEVNGVILANLTLLSFGLLGLACGFIGLERMAKCKEYLAAIVLFYVGYLILITRLGPLYWVQIIGVCLSIMLLYGFSQCTPGKTRVASGVALIGRYSLVGYIGQIGILQLLKAVSMSTGRGVGYALVMLLAAVCLTILFIAVLDAVRKKSKVTNAFYRLAFG